MSLSPAFEPRVLVTHWPRPIGELPAPDWLVALCAIDGASPWPAPGEAEKTAVRDLLRAGGFSPAGRNKPCCEYIRAAAAKGEFPRISGPVDAVNAVALHAAIPAGILDLDLLQAPLSLIVAPKGASYVFNRSGQTLELSGLLVITDAAGPCSSPIKDPMHAKTTDATQRTLTIVWGTSGIRGRADEAVSWLIDVFGRLGGASSTIAVEGDRIAL
jgi:DNA/RNA-binding domain of Phe-tRNA-synthetase-like protein